MADVQLNAQALVTTSATTAPAAGTSETWTVSALPAGFAALGPQDTYALVDATTGEPGPVRGQVLVVGTGEYGFAALLLAEDLAAAGAETFVQATTRSPVLLGGAIGHARRFSALSGEGHDEFLYNVPDDHPYTRVILLCEDRLPPAGHPVLDIPRLECKLAPVPSHPNR